MRILLVLLLAVSLSMAQVTIFNHTFNDEYSAIGTMTSQTFKANTSVSGKFNGLIKISLDYDEIDPGLCADDAFTVYMDIENANEWVPVGPLLFYQAVTGADFASSASSITIAHKDWMMAAYINGDAGGSAPNNITELPYNIVRFRLVKSTVINGYIRLQMDIY
jgi:hypothetical protein